MPIILEWSAAREWLRGADPAALLHRAPDDALRECAGSVDLRLTGQALDMKIKRLFTR